MYIRQRRCPWTTNLEIQGEESSPTLRIKSWFSKIVVSLAFTFYIFLNKISSWIILQLNKVTGVIQKHLMSEN